MKEGIKIDPDAFYDTDLICDLLQVKRSSLDKIRRSGELKSVKKINKHVCRGQWLIDWLESADPATEVAHG